LQSVHDSCIGVCVTALFLHYLPSVLVSQIFVLLYFLSSNIIVFLGYGAVQHSCPTIYVQICSALSSPEH